MRRRRRQANYKTVLIQTEITRCKFVVYASKGNVRPHLSSSSIVSRGDQKHGFWDLPENLKIRETVNVRTHSTRENRENDDFVPTDKRKLEAAYVLPNLTVTKKRAESEQGNQNNMLPCQNKQVLQLPPPPSSRRQNVSPERANFLQGVDLEVNRVSFVVFDPESRLQSRSGDFMLSYHPRNTAAELARKEFLWV